MGSLYQGALDDLTSWARFFSDIVQIEPTILRRFEVLPVDVGFLDSDLSDRGAEDARKETEYTPERRGFTYGIIDETHRYLVEGKNANLKAFEGRGPKSV